MWRVICPDYGPVGPAHHTREAAEVYLGRLQRDQARERRSCQAEHTIIEETGNDPVDET